MKILLDWLMRITRDPGYDPEYECVYCGPHCDPDAHDYKG